GGGRVIGLTGQHQFDELPAAGDDPVALLLRGVGRHVDPAGDAELPTGEGHALGVIAGAGRDHPGIAFGRRELDHAVEGAADLVGAHRLLILALEVHPRAGLLAQPLAVLQRRRLDHLGDAGGRRRDVGGAHRWRGGRGGILGAGHGSPSSRRRLPPAQPGPARPGTGAARASGPACYPPRQPGPSSAFRSPISAELGSTRSRSSSLKVEIFSPDTRRTCTSEVPGWRVSTCLSAVTRSGVHSLVGRLTATGRDSPAAETSGSTRSLTMIDSRPSRSLTRPRSSTIASSATSMPNTA